MSTNTYCFRPAKKEDLDNIYKLFSTGLDDIERKYFPCTIDEVEAILNSAKDYAYVVSEGTPGHLIAYGHMRTFNGKYAIPAMGIMVSKYFRGLGLSKSLYLHMEAEMKSRGYKEIMLKVNVSNKKAAQLYLALGYHAYKWDGQFSWMKKRLS